MKKLISLFTAAVLSTATLAAAGQGAMGKAAEKARDKEEKRERAREQDNRRDEIRRGDYRRYQRRDLKADEKELKRLRKDLKQAEKSRDWRRAQRDRAAISRLEYEIRAERQYIKTQGARGRGRDARAADSWWARHIGRSGR